jgi:peptidylprolyl isomerase
MAAPNSERIHAMTLPRLALLACALTLAIGSASQAAEPAKKGKTMQEVIDASTAADWRTPDPANTLYLDLAGGRVVIELAPQFAPRHVANIRTLAKEHYWDGLAILRSQDNFVVPWGDPVDAEKEPAKVRSMGSAEKKLPAEFTTKAELDFTRLPDVDGWAKQVGFVDGFPVGRDPKVGTWLAHCYGTVGAGRGNEIDSSTGAELYVVTGQAPRQLDRNITTVGKVLKGMELLSALPRGTMGGGFYEFQDQYTWIRSIKLASEVPEAERTNLQVMRTDTPTWQALVESRRNRQDAFYHFPVNHIDLCNVPVPVRDAPKAP